MQLSEVGFTEKEINKLNKKGFYTVEDVQAFFPRKYYDFTKIRSLQKQLNGSNIAFVGTLTEVSSKKTNNILMLKAKVIEEGTGRKLHVMWIGSYYLRKIIEPWQGEDVLVCGQLSYEDTYHSFHMNNPVVFTKKIEENLKIFPVYTKFDGISEEWMQDAVEKCLKQECRDMIPEDVVKKRHLPSMKETLFSMHHPASINELKVAYSRLIFNSLYCFDAALEMENNKLSKGSMYNAKSLSYVQKYIEQLPFSLTDSQKKAYNTMKDLAFDGRRINALVQGDVGSGKTAVAFLMMFLMAGAGYQSALMAPTEILARQHYEELNRYADIIGIKSCFLNGKMKKKEKDEILKGIKDGSIQLIVGTTSVVSKDVEYKDLSLAIVDEEHRFGVGAENTLFSKSEKGMHKIVMSATPIPRTITDVLFDSSTLVFDLERPAGRQEVQTCIFNNDEKIYAFLEKQIKEGRQAFVVCPLIEDGTGKSKNKLSVERVTDDYIKRFEMSGIKVSSVTGKTKTDDAKAILDDFKIGNTDILVSTTVIEVGVNNPNVSTIIINNAEMFGVAQLHQLRGRVGRGQYKGYCILKSAERDNKRLQLLCSTTDGFVLAKKDAELRGPGDILGERQSGANKDIELVLKFPDWFKEIRKEVKERIINGKTLICE